MRLTALGWLTAAALFGDGAELANSAPPDLNDRQVALLKEVDHLTSQLGPSLWPSWAPATGPFVLRTTQWEYLRRHPNPPPDFRPLRSRVLGQRVWVRPTPDSLDLQAAFPLGGRMTAVVSQPDAEDDPAVWVLKAAHELFHVHQGPTRVVDPFRGSYAATNDLTFPFPYGDSVLNAAWRLEAESVFLLATGDSLTRVIHRRLLPLSWRLARALVPDSLLLQYKQLTEWTEGVARYTERELSRRAAEDQGYHATAAFAAAFPGASYQAVWTDYYAGQLAPIRFVGEGVRGRVMFYYLGMGKAYALDRRNPDWRDRYAGATLDALLLEPLR